MDGNKLDLALRRTLAAQPDNTQEVQVFIETVHAPRVEQFKWLDRLGVATAGDDSRTVYTATVTPSALELLTEQNWIKRVRLSRMLQPLATR